MLKQCSVNTIGIKIKVVQFWNDSYNFCFKKNHHKQSPADRKKKIAENRQSRILCISFTIKSTALDYLATFMLK